MSGAVVPAGRFLEATDADDRYSADQRAAAAALLGVAPNATKEEVRKAFRMKAFKAKCGRVVWACRMPQVPKHVFCHSTDMDVKVYPLKDTVCGDHSHVTC